MLSCIIEEVRFVLDWIQGLPNEHLSSRLEWVWRTTMPMLPMVIISLFFGISRWIANKVSGFRSYYILVAMTLSSGVCWFAWGWSYFFWTMVALVIVLGYRGIKYRCRKSKAKFCLISGKENRHVVELLDGFICEKNGQRAIMISGDWGCGKTFFINQYKNYREKIFPKKKIFYCSANGVSTREELLGLFLTNLGLKKALGGFSQKDVTFSLAGAGVSFSFSQLAELVFPDKWAKEEIDLIIIDDLERCISTKFSVAQVFACINELVEHEKMRVCVLCDESKIGERIEELKVIEDRKKLFSEKDSLSFRGQRTTDVDKKLGDTSWRKYSCVKEKVIGRTILIKPDIDSLISTFTGNKNNSEGAKVISEKQQLIKSFAWALRCKNLRAIQATLEDCCLCIDKLAEDDNFKKSAENAWGKICNEILSVVSYVGLKVHSESWDLSEILERKRDFSVEVSDLLKMYGITGIAIYSLPESIWDSLYKGHPFDGRVIRDTFRGMMRIGNDAATILRKFPEVEDAQFEMAQNEIDRKLSGKEEFALEDILTIFPFLLEHREYFSSFKEEDLLERGKKCIENADKKNLEDFISRNRRGVDDSLMSQLNLFAYSIVNREKTSLFKNRIEHLHESDIENLIKTVREFRELNTHSEICLFDWGSVCFEDFFSSLKSCKNSEISSLCTFFYLYFDLLNEYLPILSLNQNLHNERSTWVSSSQTFFCKLEEELEVCVNECTRPARKGVLSHLFFEIKKVTGRLSVVKISG